MPPTVIGCRRRMPHFGQERPICFTTDTHVECHWSVYCAAVVFRLRPGRILANFVPKKLRGDFLDFPGLEWWRKWASNGTLEPPRW